MPRKAANSASVVLPAKYLKVQAEGNLTVRPLSQAVASLAVISSETQNQEAAEVLSLIAQAEGQWAEKMDPVLQPLKQAMTAAEILDRSIRMPLAALRKTLRDAMGVWATAVRREQLRIEAENREAERKRQEKASQLAAKVATSKGVARVRAEQQLEIATQPVLVAEAPSARTETTGTRVVKTWQAPDLEAVIVGIVSGSIPIDAVCLDSAYCHQAYRSGELVKWPGFKEVEEVQIVERRR